jgi:penicillin-binding protein 1A
VLATVFVVYTQLELPDAPPIAKTTQVLDRHGKQITTFHAEVDRTPIPLKDMPQHLRNAVIAMEDRDFYGHKGVSWWGIARAAWADLRSRRLEQGGSTITQQYVKTVYTGAEKTILRKIKEGMLALKLEKEFTKDQILGRYLNAIYFGRGAYGIQAAARTYFGVAAKQLTLNQSATLAGIISAPESYNPITNPEEARVRRNLALDRMVEEEYITRATATKTRAEDIEVVLRAKPQLVEHGADFVHYVRRQLLGQLHDEEVFAGGLRVKTTLDLEWQQAAEAAVSKYLGTKGDPFVALVAIDPKSREVRAMVGGGKNKNSVDFNFATEGHRHAGSAFKPFTFAAAMENGISPFSVWTGPSSITIDDPRCDTPGETPPEWRPSNAGDSSAGRMSLLNATALSVNTIYAQLVTDLPEGPASVAELAHRVGIRSDLQSVCSITLGSGGDVSPFEMTNAYATFANNGRWAEPTGVIEVKKGGTKLPLTREEPRKAMLPNDAHLVSHALQGVVQYGTGTAAGIGRPVAGKTGTSQEGTDAWFCGYTTRLVTCVWMGYRTRIPMHDIGGFTNIYGGTIPALIWHDFMAVATADDPVEDFPTPSFDGKDLSAFEPDPEPTGSPSPLPSPSPSPSPSPEPSPQPSPTTPSPEPSGTASPDP